MKVMLVIGLGILLLGIVSIWLPASTYVAAYRFNYDRVIYFQKQGVAVTATILSSEEGRDDDGDAYTSYQLRFPFGQNGSYQNASLTIYEGSSYPLSSLERSEKVVPILVDPLDPKRFERPQVVADQIAFYEKIAKDPEGYKESLKMGQFLLTFFGLLVSVVAMVGIKRDGG